MEKIYSFDIKKVFENLIKPGDDLLVHSSLKNIGFFHPSPEIIIDNLEKILTELGTLIMMSDTRSFAETKSFSLTQKSETGLLSECFRKRSNVKRSTVPMISFCASGARSSLYTEIYNSYLDKSSPFTHLLKNNGKIMLFGIGFQKCTLYHLAEERYQVPYNFYKTFKGHLISGDQKVPISQRYFVRKNLKTKKNNRVATELMIKKNFLKKEILGSGEILVFNARDYDECCMEILKCNRLAFLEQNN
ncbi:hypothetical protein CU311_06785 [Prochlorococcus marinus str. MU1402]|uniref:AAC(3) family N-acetyltransferase n=1 Tax=Prochlorococcus marinus TaxID=1219 RepID=UPI001ADBF9FC|nr:AAC(3) family N-acetyltransferase [Prochlorococcus marinus]MBO8232386.1 AAC(3) family N-acetyltransferase [Prochlorococcus marinus XMU1402]MBW3057113.1 hypothetical protein [Prochlorococcus marinus str. MU1402]